MPTVVTLLGIVMLVSEPHCLNASFPTLSTLLGIVMLVSADDLKAFEPIEVTLFGISIDASDVH